jgi:hypothetical protein
LKVIFGGQKVILFAENHFCLRAEDHERAGDHLKVVYHFMSRDLCGRDCIFPNRLVAEPPGNEE